MGAISAEGVKVFCDIPYMEIEEFKCTENIPYAGEKLRQSCGERKRYAGLYGGVL